MDCRRAGSGVASGMAEGPDIARIGALIGDPARANMLLSLMGGRALTATELAAAAGVTVQTASSHLAKLEDGGLLRPRKQGRHRYFSFADEQVGLMLESLMGFSASRGHLRHRVGPREPALRKARVCYDHLAGDYGVRMLDGLRRQGAIDGEEEHPRLTPEGETLLAADWGLDIGALRGKRRPLCKACLDWSERRTHLGGTLGRALLDTLLDRGLARRVADSRVIEFTPDGERRFQRAFPPAD